VYASRGAGKSACAESFVVGLVARIQGESGSPFLLSGEWHRTRLGIGCAATVSRSARAVRQRVEPGEFPLIDSA